jgi:uncharacterized membrane protein SirB2
MHDDTVVVKVALPYGGFIIGGLVQSFLKRGSTKAIRVVAWVLALLVFTYIVMVAMAHSPLPFEF